MKAVVVKHPGGIKALKLMDYPLPKVRPGWSLVKVRAFGINRSEIFTRQGLSPSVKFPRILGIECVGQIVATSDKKRLPIKQKVISLMGEMGRAFDGSYAEYVLVPNQQIYPVETSLDWVDLAAIPETYYTAFIALRNLKITAQDKVLVRGATSGVGLAFGKLARAKFPHLSIYGSTRQKDKLALLTEQGFSKGVIDEDNTLQTPVHFDKLLELIGPKTIKNSIQVLNSGRIICSCGQLGRQWYLENFDPIEELANDIYLTTSASKNVNEQRLQALLDYISHYQIDTSPQKVYSLEQIRLAHKYLESKQSFGKVVVTLG